MIRLFKGEPWSLDPLSPPWGGLKSIFEHIESGSSDPLPDESIVFQPNKLRWAAGAMDGIFGGPAEGKDAEKRIFTLVDAVRRLQQRASNEALRNLYGLIGEGALVGSIDRVLEELSKYPSPDHHRFLQIGRYFATRAGHREAVKFGLALVGAFGSSHDLEIPETLGTHDEFTLFAAIALARISPDPEIAFWNLAKNVKGWGRIQIVRRLYDTQNPEIQGWMIRAGFRNDVMDEYLACICARAGRLHDALNQQFVDNELLDAAGDIIRALITGGPAEGIDDYEHSADVCEAYLNIVWSRDDLDLRHFLVVARLKSFLEQSEGWEKRAQHGWSDSRGKLMQPLASDVLSQRRWRELTTAALASTDRETFFEGEAAAQILKIDTWEIHFARVKADPLGSSSWYDLMKQTNDSRVEEVLTFAESALPLQLIETGPGDLLGLGPEFQLHGTLDWILQDLCRFPGRGWRFISAGFRSPVVRNRNMAIKALAAWPLDSLGQEKMNLIKQVRDAEPVADVKRRFDNLLAGDAIS